MVEAESRTAPGEDSYLNEHDFTPALGRHLITYLMGGALTALLYYAILVAGLLTLGKVVPYLYVVVVSNFATVVIVYPWYRLVVFRGAGGSWLAGYLRFYAVGLTGLVTSLVGLPILVELAGVPILVAQVLLIVASVPLNYALYRIWTFRDRAGGRFRRTGRDLRRGGRIDER
ncbi:GtrA family protein [Sphaerisporangium perillae]|uniref:GtrA family protein n=1 Tax=Sphaerisporangium perillae TaxID=2935860 RepID=UPI00200FAFAA|nr:GtrA family protein [Sphaerisporangium perillae]